MIVISLSFLIVLPAEALDWDGDSSGGGGSGVDTNIKGFSIRFTDNQNMLGYRFSVIDRSGNIKSNKIIDVFRKTSAAPYANKACGTSYYKFSTKRNKKQLIENQNGSFSTKQCDTNCYKESEMGFDTELTRAKTRSLTVNAKMRNRLNRTATIEMHDNKRQRPRGAVNYIRKLLK